MCTNFPEGGLVLLTHLTDPPEEFATNMNKDAGCFRLAVRSTCRWAEVHKWLGAWQQNNEKASQTAAIIFLSGLMQEFRQFLEVQKMVAIDMDGADLEAVGLYLSREIWAKVRQLLDTARDAALKTWPEGISTRSRPSSHLVNETQLLWDWIYPFKELTWYVGWGFATSRGLMGVEIELPADLQAFLLVTSEPAYGERLGKEIVLATSEIETMERNGWKMYYSNPANRAARFRIVRFRNARDFAESPSGFNSSFQGWLRSGIEEARSILNAAHGRLKKPI